MKIRAYLRDRMFMIMISIFLIVMLTAMQMAFKVNSSCIFATVVLIVLAFSLILVFDCVKRNRFYNDLLLKLDGLDQKYLITEMLEEPEFEEGRILKDSLYEAGKSMKERINHLSRTNNEFKEYLEMWIHEVKLPLSALTLMNYNGNIDVGKQKQLIRKIEYYVEQILFMARADEAGKDYLMKKCNLEMSVNKAVLSNKDMLIESRVSVEKENLDLEVITDGKWLEFILGQIISNSVKYVRGDERKIRFTAYENKDKTILTIMDNGIGISAGDIANVFEKTFTGENGRKVAASTGMGLYICKKLCKKMGHKIWIESEQNQYTKVYIEFGKDSFYTM